MKITPLEIRQKTFEKAFRGLDKDEVHAYLTTLSQEWEKQMDENKELRIKLDTTLKEVEKLREVENSLFKTLKTAGDTGANMIDQATQAAKLHMRETEMKAEALLNDARTKARNMIEEAEMRSRSTTEDLEDYLRQLAQVYRSLESARADMVSGIKNSAQEALDRTERLGSPNLKVDIEEKLLQLRKNFFDKSDYQLLEQEKSDKPQMLSSWLKADKEVNGSKEPENDQEEDIEEKEEKKKPADQQKEKPASSQKEEESVTADHQQKHKNKNSDTSFFDDIE